MTTLAAPRTDARFLLAASDAWLRFADWLLARL
jgi:hypothetical protein